ncbi:MAG: DUF4440 domain-containing protein [Dehalococcoidia bacterium]|nr:DUF4440 domain-containing protein [Dehalococcoidia bacterium]
MIDAKKMRGLEQQLLLAVVNKSIDKLNLMLAEDFLEVGRSGRKYNKRQVIESLTRVGGSPVPSITQFKMMELSDGLFLSNYVSTNKVGGLISRRTSIWRRSGAKWHLVFHQGTPTTL